ncbi:MAG TPA: NIPSNAP family protein [Bacillota bacterium]|nr:NIPSNAP family protein [Bacillota bacterium]
MLYEYRVYEAMPGKTGALNARFRTATMALFEKHGFRVVGFWEPVFGTSNELHYILGWEDLGERQRAWDAFQSDPAWHKVRQESERDGVLTGKIHTQIWKPTDYSPLK